MQDILKRLITELHEDCFKPNGFNKTGGRFLRTDGLARQKLMFSASRWNSTDGPVSFTIYFWLEFTDITYDDSSPYSGLPLSTLAGYIGNLVPDALGSFDLTPANYERIRSHLLEILPRALQEWPKHYEKVRSQLKKGERLWR